VPGNESGTSYNYTILSCTRLLMFKLVELLLVIIQWLLQNNEHTYTNIQLCIDIKVDKAVQNVSNARLSIVNHHKSIREFNNNKIYYELTDSCSD